MMATPIIINVIVLFMFMFRCSNPLFRYSGQYHLREQVGSSINPLTHPLTQVVLTNAACHVFRVRLMSILAARKRKKIFHDKIFHDTGLSP